MDRDIKRLAWIGVLLPLLVVAVLWISGVFTMTELQLQDRLYQHPKGAAPNIFVIGIDENTVNQMGPFANWSRLGVAGLVEKLMEDPEHAPAVIGLDIGFYGNRDELVDQALADACARAGNVVVASAATFGEVPEIDEQGRARLVRRILVMEEPYQALGMVVSSGHTNIDMDKDGVMRRSQQYITYGGRSIESFAAAVYRAYTGEEAQVELDAGGSWRIPYSARPYEYYGPTGYGASFVSVYDGSYPAAAFQDAIVLVGAYAQGMMDSFDTPVSRETRMYGVEVHANILQALLEGKRLYTLPFALEALICALVWVLGMAALIRLKFRYSLPLVVILGAVYVLIAIRLSEAGLMLPLIAPVTGLAGMMVFGFGMKFTAMWRQRRRIVADFSRYLPKEIARHIAERGSGALQLGGTRRELAVLFVDIRGFTPLSEKMDPEELVSILNEFLHLTTTCIFDQQGTVDKFIGDATMALFNAPVEVDDYIYRAVCAGLDMVKGSRALMVRLNKMGFCDIGFGVGINCGEAVVGNIGSAHRMEYTAIGDTVNTAARLESQALAGQVLISKAVYEAVADRIDCTYLGERSLKGKQEPVPIWCANSLSADKLSERSRKGKQEPVPV